MEEIFKDVAKHRIVLGTKARVTKISEDAILSQILSEVTQPSTNVVKKLYRRG